MHVVASVKLKSMEHLATLKLVLSQTEEHDHNHTTSVHVLLLYTSLPVICPNKTRLYDIKLVQTQLVEIATVAQQVD